jgi:hypothetical protein
MIELFETLLAIYGIFHLIYDFCKYVTKIIFNDFFMYKQTIKDIYERRPNQKSNGKLIKILDIDITQVNLHDYDIRYDKKDISDYIHKLEKIKVKNNILLRIIELLYEIKNHMMDDNEFEVKFKSFILNKIIYDELNKNHLIYDKNKMNNFRIL